MLTIRPTYTHKFNISPNLKFCFFFSDGIMDGVLS